MQEENLEVKKEKAHELIILASASTLYNTCIKINNSCIKVIKSKNIKKMHLFLMPVS